MKDWLRDILLDEKTLGRGYFERAGVERLISTDLASGGHSKELFSLAVLELWHRAFLDSAGIAEPRLQVPRHDQLTQSKAVTDSSNPARSLAGA